ncbi:MAG: hypothetical protein IB618_03240 [Candidatus Pacearchaeota archaeon]|nr:MAG: hypothetical protein IB618_03240 [Candidatus Pacearchaeota archaeon]
MLVKILGIFDLFVALILFLLALEVGIPLVLILIIIILLAVKSLPFILSFDIASIIDLFVAIFILINLIFGLPTILLIIAALAIGQKGVFSLL